MFSFLQNSAPKHPTHLDQIATLIISSPQTLGPLSVLFPSDFFTKHSTNLDQIATLIIYSHQTPCPLSVLFPSDFFIKTLYTPRPNRLFNNFLPSSSVSPKCSLSIRFLHQTLYKPRPNHHLIITSHQTLVPVSFLFLSDFFNKTLYTHRPNRNFKNILPSNSGPPKCSLSFRFLH